jgi:hypothetical protein
MGKKKENLNSTFGQLAGGMAEKAQNELWRMWQVIAVQ